MDLVPVGADPSVVYLVDGDVSRRNALAQGLRALGMAVTEATEDTDVPATAVGTVLVAWAGRHAGTLRAVVHRLRGSVADRQVLAVTPAGADGSRDALTAAQSAGCDGCLVYAHPTEVASVLRACVLGGVPCG